MNSSFLLWFIDCWGFDVSTNFHIVYFYYSINLVKEMIWYYFFLFLWFVRFICKYYYNSSIISFLVIVFLFLLQSSFHSWPFLSFVPTYSLCLIRSYDQFFIFVNVTWLKCLSFTYKTRNNNLYYRSSTLTSILISSSSHIGFVCFVLFCFS